MPTASALEFSGNINDPLLAGDRQLIISDDLPLEDRTPCYIPARFVLTGMLFSGLFLVYALRVNLSIALVAMVNQTALHNNVSFNDECPFDDNSSASSNGSSFDSGGFDWDKPTQGLILSAFFYGYVPMQMLGGGLAEVYGGKWLLGIGILFTGLLSLLVPVAAYWSPYAVIAVRILTGLGESVTYPSFYVMMNMWYPLQEQNTHYSISSNGATLGTIVTLPIAAWLCQCSFLGGWPLVFYAFGGVTCVWFLFWVFFVFSVPEEHPRISIGELQYIQSHRHGHRHTPKGRRIPWKAILTSRAVWALALAKFGSSWAFYVLLTDLPTYLDNILHFSLQSNGTLNSLIFLAQAVTGICTGICADFLRTRSSLSITTIRKAFHFTACCSSAVCLLLVERMGCNWDSAYALLLSASALMGISVAGAEPVNMDMAPNFAGTVGGFTNGYSNLAGVFAPMVTGFIIEDNTLSAWGRVFSASAFMFFGAIVAFCLFGSADVQPWAVNTEYTQLPAEETDPDLADPSSSDADAS